MFESPYQPESIALEGLERYGTVFTYKANKTDATPMMRQFLDVKEQYRDLILLYRMGDFYETFFEDAVLTARHLELTLTGKDCGALGKIPMAGVPVKSVDVYVPRLLNAGFKIALCEQMEDPATAKGLVKREVVRILSAGTVNESQQLTPHNAHYLAAIVLPKGLNQTTKDAHLIKTPCALAYVDISTGRFCVSEFPYAHLLTELDRLAPQELLVQGVLQKSEIPGIPGRWMPDVPAELQEKAPCTPLAKEVITQKNAYERIAQWLNVSSLEGYGLYETDTALIQACGMIVHYLNYSFLQTPLHLDGIQRLYADKHVRLSANARKHLELLPNPKESSCVSLFQILNRCMTPMGQRLLKDWVACPTHFLPELESRLEAVEDLVNQPHTRQLLRQLLPNIYDLERLATRLANLSATPRELGALAQSLKVLPRLSQTVLRCSAFYLERLKAFPPEVGQALALMENALQDELPATLKEGGIIRAQFSPTLDELRHLVNDQAQWIDAYEAQEREATGIKHLKVQFTNATGYFIEVSKGSVSQVPERYRPKQSLTNATRFMTPELRAHESAVWDAQNRLLHVETDLFLQLRRQLLPYAPVLKEVAHRLACLDVLQSYAEVAQVHGYSRPCLVETPILELQQVRHPVIEQQLPKGRFVPNNTALAGQVSPQQARRCPQVEIITGPNMAGKSTYMRQVALCVLMAHIGCFVPATHATIGVVDAIFTRIGAMDNVSKGQSTFMVEMAETAEILNTATAQSLVILDEVGRGTSTYDGVAIAWSVVEHLVEHVGARTLFATHYHELNVLELAHPALVQNVRMVVAEQEGELVFLHRVEAGAAQKSYGIQVARMAGLPSRVLQQATGRLNDMQKMANHQLRQRRSSLTGLSEDDTQLSIF